MRRRLVLCSLLALGASGVAVGQTPDTVRVGPEPGALEAAVLGAEGPTVLQLAPGQYVLRATAFVDSTCGNCEDPDEDVPATFGLRVSGNGLELVGAGADRTTIHTTAGYGIFFERCRRCALRDVTVTGGARDPDGRATDAAVVVKHSSVTLDGCVLRDNIGDSATVAGVVVGVAGIAGREGSDITVRACQIIRNSWDGIALYRGASADIRHNVVDGVDRARGATVGGGRGVGIGLTWDARATVHGNLVRNYWKGVGVFVNADATIRHNVIEDILTWGIAYWAAGEGAPAARIEDNIVFRTGACGVMVDRGTPADADPGHLSGNVIFETGQDTRYDSGEPYCHQRPIARHAVPERFEIEGNWAFGNRQPGQWPRTDEAPSREAFLRAARALASRLSHMPHLAASTALRALAP